MVLLFIFFEDFFPNDNVKSMMPNDTTIPNRLKSTNCIGFSVVTESEGLKRIDTSTSRMINKMGEAEP